MSGRAEYAARYPKELCRAICRGLIEEMRQEDEGVKSLFTLKGTETIRREYGVALRNGDDEHEEEKEWEELIQKAWDDSTGKELKVEEVKKARVKEIGYAEETGVWTKITSAEAEKRGYEIIKTRWIDINTGDEERPNYRSRLVAKELNNGEGEGLFAATPPLEAMRL